MGKKKPGKETPAKALLKVYVDPAILRRARMSAAAEGKKLGDLVAQILDTALPDWRQK